MRVDLFALVPRAMLRQTGLSIFVLRRSRSHESRTTVAFTMFVFVTGGVIYRIATAKNRLR